MNAKEYSKYCNEYMFYYDTLLLVNSKNKDTILEIEANGGIKMYHRKNPRDFYRAYGINSNTYSFKEILEIFE